MELLYTGKDHELDEISKPENLVKALPYWQSKMDAIAEARHLTDLAAKSGYNGQRLAGYAGEAKNSSVKVIARIPEALLTVLIAAEPELLSSNKAWHKWIKKHPEFRAYSEGSKL